MNRSTHYSLPLREGWQFRPEGQENWQTISLPHSPENHGLPHDWEGPVWYRITLFPRHDWQPAEGRRLWLRFCAVSYACKVWVNGQEVGEHRGAWDAFTFEITSAAANSPEVEILVRTVKPGGPTFPTSQTTAGFLPYVWGFLHGGIWQNVTLERTGPVRLPDHLRLQTSAANHRLTLTSEDSPLLMSQNELYALSLLDTYGLNVCADAFFASERNDDCGASVLQERPWELSVPDAVPWSPERPVVYTAVIRLFHNGLLSDEATLPVGFRDIEVQGDTPLLNGKPFYPRMPLSWGWYPETLHPNPAPEIFHTELENIQTLGYNGVKCCLWVPPPAYLNLCDQLGLLVWLELPLWLPEMDAAQWESVSEEYRRIVRQVRHHPCIVIWTLGCELSTSCPAHVLKQLYDDVKTLTGSPLVRDNSGGGECYGGLLQEYADFYDFHFYCDLPFLRATFDYFLPRWRPPQPWLFGEFCDADAFRDLVALSKRIPEAGGRRPEAEEEEWLEETETQPVTPGTPSSLPWWTQDSPQRNPQGVRWDMHVLGQWANMERYSLFSRREELKEGQRRQTLLHRKFTVERVRSYREMSGYVITGLRDTPISIAGMFDDFGESRYTPQEFARFNADTVLFLGWHRRRDWKAGGDRPSYIDHACHWAGEMLFPRIGISHYGAEDSIAEVWITFHDLQTGAEADFGVQQDPLNPAESQLTPGSIKQLATFSCTAPDMKTMTRFLLRARLTTASGKQIENEWPIWIVPKPDWDTLLAWNAYDPDGRLHGLEAHGASWTTLAVPPTPPEESTLLLASRWHENLAEYARKGGKAVVFVDAGGGLPVEACPFWREAMKLFEPHPLWDHFPHQGFTDLHFYGLGPDCAFSPEALFALLPDAVFRPLLRRVDARTFAVTDYLTEAVFPSTGSLLFTTLRPHGGLGDQPDGLLRHVAGVQFLAAAMQVQGVGCRAS